MNRRELKELVFSEFEAKMQALVDQQRKYQKNLDQGKNKFCDANGPAAANGLTNLTVTLADPEEGPAKPPRTTKKRKTSRKRKQPKTRRRVSWSANINEAVRGLTQGITRTRLKKKMVKAGVPEKKFAGSAFSTALTALVEKGEVKVKQGKYLA